MELKATPHPLLTRQYEEITGLIAALRAGELSEEGAKALAVAIQEHERRLALAEEDPGRYGWHEQLEHWKDALALVKECGIGVYIGGGKRATKSEFCAFISTLAAQLLEGGKVWCFQGNEKTSIAEQQPLVWKYLFKENKALEGKSKGVGGTNIRYSVKGGFTEGSLVLPSGSQMFFMYYNMKASDYQGWKIGFPLTPKNLAMMDRYPWLVNVGAWLDEDAPVDWISTCEMRCSDNSDEKRLRYSAKVVFGFSVLKGITPAVRELIAKARTVKSVPVAELPATMRHVPDCPLGHAPYTMDRLGRPGWRAIFFRASLNPFGQSYASVRARTVGKPPKTVLQDLYGWSEETKSLAFPMFGAWNVITREQLPAVGTNYFFTDPAEARPFVSAWVRVTPGNPPSFYVYRDWPPAKVYGPWAVPSSEGDEPNGERGPAQRGLGFGFQKMKEVWAAEERVLLTVRGDRIAEADPYRRALLERFLAEAGELTPAEDGGWRIANGERAIEKVRDAGLTEDIFENYIDPRAGKAAKTTQGGGTCVIDEFGKKHLDPNTGRVLAAPRYFRPWPGILIDDGIKEINDLLWWNKDLPEGLVPGFNQPHLYVVEDCEQVIWALSNHVADGDEKAACKDFVDLLRGMATAGLRYVSDEARKVKGGGCY